MATPESAPLRAAAAELDDFLVKLARAERRPSPKTQAQAAALALRQLDTGGLDPREAAELAKAGSPLPKLVRASYRAKITEPTRRAIEKMRERAEGSRGRLLQRADHAEVVPIVWEVVRGDAQVPIEQKEELRKGGRRAQTDLTAEFILTYNLTPGERDRALWLLDDDTQNYPGYYSGKGVYKTPMPTITRRAKQLGLFENPRRRRARRNAAQLGLFDAPPPEPRPGAVEKLKKRKGAIIHERDEIRTWQRALSKGQGAQDPEYEREMDRIRRQLEALWKEYGEIEDRISLAEGTPLKPRRTRHFMGAARGPIS